MIVNINGSPYHHGKGAERLEVCRLGAETGAWIVYVNAVGGQDELVFDGGSMVVSPDGDVVARAAMFEEDLVVVDVDARGGRPATPKRREPRGPTGPGGGLPGAGARPRATTSARTGSARSCSGCRAGSTRRSSRRSPPTRSGRKPSAARDAIAVLVARRASRTPWTVRSGSASGSTVPIDDVFDAYRRTLADLFAGTEEGVAEENLQARIRGNLLMALSNKFGSLVLATGNKCEYAVGYATLYGDMAGGFAPIKDVPKTLVYELCAWRNAQGRRRAADPASDHDKPPSAELRPNQPDTDSLPPYDVLDPIIEAYVEDDLAGRHRRPGLRPGDGRARDRDDRSRRVQAAAGRAGREDHAEGVRRDRRLPITNRYGLT